MSKFTFLFPLLFCFAALTAYTPVQVPNGSTLPFTLEDGWKVFHLVAEPISHEFSHGLSVNCWGYNGQTPGPMIEAVEGDKVRIIVTNHLPEPTTIHWHGILLPNAMDGVTGLTQKPIMPKETYTYEFTLRQSGTYMYHPHFDDMTQIALGMMGFFIIHPKKEEKVDRDYAIMLMEWAISPGTKTPDPLSLDFNYFTFNSCVYPKAASLVAKLGEKVRIRFGNLSMNSHPIHLHGYLFNIVAMGARKMQPSSWQEAVTVNVPVGETRDIEFVADEPGDWALHCHKSHHTMNGMVHDLPNMLGVSREAVGKIVPHLMGTKGMGDMFLSHHDHGSKSKLPNFLPFGNPGPFGTIELSGMFTILKVRKEFKEGQELGWYLQPKEL